MEADFLQIFSYDVIGGTKDALADKKNMVLSESTAKALFGSVDAALGRPVAWEFPYGKGEAIVGAVIKNMSPQSSYHADFLLSFEIFKGIVGPQDLHWGNFGCNTYVLLKPNTDGAAVSRKIENFVKSKDKNARITLFLLPYSTYYLHGNYTDGKPSGGRIEYVRLFALIGIVIVSLARRVTDPAPT